MIDCRCRYCKSEWEAEQEERVCKKCRESSGTKFMLVYDPSPPDCAYTWHGIFGTADLQDENMKGCRFINLKNGKEVQV